MLPDQVVHAIATAGGLGKQVMVVQAIEMTTGGVEVAVVEGSYGIGVNLSARMQPEAAEQPLLGRREVLI